MKDLGGKLKDDFVSAKVQSYSPTYYYKNKRIDKKEFEYLFTSLSSNEIKENLFFKPIIKYFTVFNISDIKNIEHPQIVNNIENNIDAAEENIVNFINELNYNINHCSSNYQARYYSGKDKIEMTLKNNFVSMEMYYSTLFHEIIHMTGAENRLNRHLKSYDKKDYAQEELVSEIGATFLCFHFGINSEIKESSQYIKYWLKFAKEDNSFLYEALDKAVKAYNYLIN